MKSCDFVNEEFPVEIQKFAKKSNKFYPSNKKQFFIQGVGSGFFIMILLTQRTHPLKFYLFSKNDVMMKYSIHY
jgi:hypothetical protein